MVQQKVDLQKIHLNRPTDPLGIKSLKVMLLSAITRSTGTGGTGCPELDLEPRIHITDDLNNEKLRQLHNQPITQE